MNSSYWQRQEPGKPLFPDVEWNRPERLDQSGRLAIIGGNKLGFSSVAEAYATAQTTGVGQVRVLLPDILKKSVPPSMTDVLFAPTNPSGSLAQAALTEAVSLRDWSDVLLLIGDSGRNSQTAIIHEELVKRSQQPVVITRDAIDLLQNSFAEILDNQHVVFVASFAQVQKIFRSVYYPKMLTFSIQLAQFVDILHKFTITYPVTICTFHAEHLVIAHGGTVVTQAWDEPMAIWRGVVGAKIASYLVWSPSSPLAAASTAVYAG